MSTDCSIFYRDGKLVSVDLLPTWYVQFLASSPPDEKTGKMAKKEMRARGVEI